MAITRGIRIFGMTIFFLIAVAFLPGYREYAVGTTLLAIIAGGFAGEAWHNSRSRARRM